MKNSMRILSLCVVMLFVFAGVSYAKTSSQVHSQNLNKADMQKILKEGITIEDIHGKKHFISPEYIKKGCSNSVRQNVGPWECLFSIMFLFHDIMAANSACADTVIRLDRVEYVSQGCIEAVDTLVASFERVGEQCAYIVPANAKLLLRPKEDAINLGLRFPKISIGKS